MEIDEIKQKTEFLWKVHSYINDYVKFADAKAGVVIVFDSGILGALYSAGFTRLFTSPVAAWSVRAWAACLVFVGLGVWAVFAAHGIVPRLWTEQPRWCAFW